MAAVWGQIAKGIKLQQGRLSFFKDVHLGCMKTVPSTSRLPLPRKTCSLSKNSLLGRRHPANLTSRPPGARAKPVARDTHRPDEARNKGDKRVKQAEKHYREVQQLHDELKTFIERASQCAEQGSPRQSYRHPPGGGYPLQMNLDDGVMLNSAALCAFGTPVGQAQNLVVRTCNVKGKRTTTGHT